MIKWFAKKCSAGSKGSEGLGDHKDNENIPAYVTWVFSKDCKDSETGCSLFVSRNIMWFWNVFFTSLIKMKKNLSTFCLFVFKKKVEFLQHFILETKCCISKTKCSLYWWAATELGNVSADPWHQHENLHLSNRLGHSPLIKLCLVSTAVAIQKSAKDPISNNKSQPCGHQNF